MDFEFSPEQMQMQDTVRGLLADHYDTARAKAVAESGGQDERVWRQLAEAGIFSVAVPEAHGGMGLGFVDLALILEEFGRALVPAPAAETLVATDVIARHATPEQQAKWLPAIAEGKLRVTLAIAEVDAAYATAFTTSVAQPAGNGWTLDGLKILVPDAAGCDLILASVHFGAGGPVGLVALDRTRAGVSLRPHVGLDRSSRHDEVTFSAVSITQDDIVGGAPSAAAVALASEGGAAAAALQMTGIAARVLDDAVAYAGQRTQFGKAIGSFQAIKHRCADMAVSLEGARSAAYYAAWAVAEDSPGLEQAVSMAKAFCGDTSRFVCREGIQIHGGIGFTWDLGLHLWVRRAKMLESAYGDAVQHRERVLARTLADLGIGA
ncbi:MAG: acyl-CoA dehydrogenase family protein [Alsobacter sp.]